VNYYVQSYEDQIEELQEEIAYLGSQLRNAESNEAKADMALTRVWAELPAATQARLRKEDAYIDEFFWNS